MRVCSEGVGVSIIVRRSFEALAAFLVGVGRVFLGLALGAFAAVAAVFHGVMSLFAMMFIWVPE